MKRAARALALGLSVGVAQGAFAQAIGSPPSSDAPPPERPAAVAGRGTASQTPEVAVEDIVVTAQRRSENLQKVPIAITALSSLKLENANIQSTADLTSITPAITLSSTVGFLEPRIRGVGNSSAGPAVENSVATYVDGVYISSSPGSLLSLDTVERIEVLKGPQGTLFGRNATAGLISIITKDPSSTFSGDAHVGYGSFNTVHGDAYVAAPIAAPLVATPSIRPLGRSFTTPGRRSFGGSSRSICSSPAATVSAARNSSASSARPIRRRGAWGSKSVLSWKLQSRRDAFGPRGSR